MNLSAATSRTQVTSIEPQPDKAYISVVMMILRTIIKMLEIEYREEGMMKSNGEMKGLEEEIKWRSRGRLNRLSKLR